MAGILSLMEKSAKDIDNWLNSEVKKHLQNIPSEQILEAKSNEGLFMGIVEHICFRTGFTKEFVKKRLTKILKT